MTVYLEPLNGISLSAALAEAAAAAPVRRAVLTTLEAWHPSMSAAIRLVIDELPLTATLEADAPRNASESVVFMASRVSLQLAEESDRAASQEISLRVDNVTGYIADALRTARAATDPAVRDAEWELIERVYVSDDTTAPAKLPVFRTALVRVGMQGATAVFTAAYRRNSSNTAIPAITFTPEAYPGLLA